MKRHRHFILACGLCLLAGELRAETITTDTEFQVRLPDNGPGFVLKRDDWRLVNDDNNPKRLSVDFRSDPRHMMANLKIGAPRSGCDSTANCLAEGLGKMSGNEKDVETFDMPPFMGVSFFYDRSAKTSFDIAVATAVTYRDGKILTISIVQGNTDGRPDRTALLTLLKGLTVTGNP